MNQVDMKRKVSLTVPADMTYAPVVTLALSGLGMIANLDVDLLCDLRTVATEALDCLLNQAGRPQCIEVCAGVEDGKLLIAFHALNRQRVQEKDELDIDITRGVLETLMQQVALETDADGVHGIRCAMPV
ncbi:MAG: hypothetical protein IKK75_04055 [Clostridia bacterium]|nr:hypothetical protein [Clostridia bacterium]